MSNPLLAAWKTPFETPPFGEIKPEHFIPAFEQAFADHTAEFAAIVNDSSEPSFDNTITALERSGKLLTRVSSVFYALVGAHSNPERLALLSTEFSHHLLAEEQGWTLELGEGDRGGLSAPFIAAAEAAAAERGKPGKAVVTLSRSSVEPFLQSSTHRDLREKVYKAFIARGDNGNDNDNSAVIGEILKLREESARLMGYPTFAAYRLEDSMAKTPQNVRNLLER